MKSHVYCGILLLLFWMSCRDKDPQKENKIIDDSRAVIIKPDFSEPCKNIYPYLDTLKYVPLELTDSSMIGSIDRIAAYKGRLYIMDMKTSSLFVYTMDGKYLFKIHSVGQGPQEYIQLDFLSIDFEQQNIVLTDLFGYWIMRYDMNGHFISRQKIPFFVEGVATIHDKGIVLYANFRDNTRHFKKEYNLYYLDSLNRIQKKYFPYTSSKVKSSMFDAAMNGGFYTYNGQCNFFRTYNDTVCQLTPNGLVAKYIFNLNGTGFDQSYLGKRIDEISAYTKKRDYNCLDNVAEDDRWLSYTFTSDIFFWMGFYSKKSGKTLTALHYDNGHQFFNVARVEAIYNSWFIAQLSVEDLISSRDTYKKQSSEGMAKKELLTLLDTLKEEANPVLVLFKLKDF